MRNHFFFFHIPGNINMEFYKSEFLQLCILCQSSEAGYLGHSLEMSMLCLCLEEDSNVNFTFCSYKLKSPHIDYVNAKYAVVFLSHFIYFPLLKYTLQIMNKRKLLKT